ncbi:MAG: AAA family ATPase [Chloroflexi bacterium]|nr:AAA family ATPase [Chloroflexota bacterium]
MISSIGIRNFKAFGDVLQQAPMSKITLIYGPNSGGKSSIIQALLLLKQSAIQAGHAATIWGLVTRGEYVDLGSYAALLHNHDLRAQLELSLKYEYGGTQLSTELKFGGVSDYDESGNEYLHDSGVLTQARYRVARGGQSIVSATLINAGGSWWNTRTSVGNFSRSHKILDFRFGDQFLPELKLLELEQLIEKNDQTLTDRERGLLLERARIREMEMRRQRVRYERLTNMTPEELAQLPELDRDLNAAEDDMLALNREPDSEFIAALDRVLQSDELLALKQIPESFKNRLNSIRYLGPLRSHPERLYKVPGVESYWSGLKGEFTHHRLYYQPGLKHLVNDWFQRFQIPYVLEVQRVGDMAVSGEHIALVLVSNASQTRVAIPDVGFGINQLLPVIVEGVDFFTGGEGRILCVEQPEIHLHPKLQANLADLMIANITGDGEKQWIVETHSELLALRMQRRIREGILCNSDVSVLYVQPDRKGELGSEIKSLRIDDRGDFIDPWPDGFFEEGFDEIVA